MNDEEMVKEIVEILANEYKIRLAGIRQHDHDPTCAHCIEWMMRFRAWADDRARHVVSMIRTNGHA